MMKLLFINGWMSYSCTYKLVIKLDSDDGMVKVYTYKLVSKLDSDDGMVKVCIDKIYFK
jgi:hypothetical protein